MDLGSREILFSGELDEDYIVGYSCGDGQKVWGIKADRPGWPQR